MFDCSRHNVMETTPFVFQTFVTDNMLQNRQKTHLSELNQIQTKKFLCFRQTGINYIID